MDNLILNQILNGLKEVGLVSDSVGVENVLFYSGFEELNNGRKIACVVVRDDLSDVKAEVRYLRDTVNEVFKKFKD